MKKIAIALFLSAILGTSVLAGCSPKEETPAPDTTQEEAAPEAEQPAAEEEFADLAELFKKGENAFKDGIYYAQTFTMTDQQSQMKTWHKGDKVKSSIVADGDEMINIIDSKTGEFITYSASEKTGMRFKADSGDSAFMPDTSMTDIASVDEQVDTATFEIVGDEKILGEDCAVILSKDKATNEEVKLWVSKKYGITMKMVSKGVDGSEMTIEVTELKVGDISDSEFEVPSDVVIEEF